MDRDEVERKGEGFLKGVALALPARLIVRAIRLNATEAGFVAINDFLDPGQRLCSCAR